MYCISFGFNMIVVVIDIYIFVVIDSLCDYLQGGIWVFFKVFGRLLTHSFFIYNHYKKHL